MNLYFALIPLLFVGGSIIVLVIMAIMQIAREKRDKP